MSDQVRKATSSERKKKPFSTAKCIQENFSAAAAVGREGRMNKPSVPAEQLPLKGTAPGNRAHHSPIRVSWDSTRAVEGPGGQLVTGSTSWKHPGTIETTWHQSPSKPKVSADPAFNSASYINQTRCSEQWLMRVSQFPPTMSAPLVLTQFVSILCSLESPLAALFFRLLCRVNTEQWAGTQENAHKRCVRIIPHNSRFEGGSSSSQPFWLSFGIQLRAGHLPMLLFCKTKENSNTHI